MVNEELEEKDEVEINKIVKFSVIADQIVSAPEVTELKEDDVIVVQLPRGTTAEEISIFNDIFKTITKIKQQVMVMFDPVEIFGLSLEEFEEMMKHVQDKKKKEDK